MEEKRWETCDACALESDRGSGQSWDGHALGPDQELGCQQDVLVCWGCQHKTPQT